MSELGLIFAVLTGVLWFELHGTIPKTTVDELLAVLGLLFPLMAIACGIAGAQ